MRSQNSDPDPISNSHPWLLDRLSLGVGSSWVASFVPPLRTDLSGQAMSHAGVEGCTSARARRERRLCHEARVRLTLVQDGARLAGHRGGPQAGVGPAGGGEVAALRSELAALRAEVAALKEALAMTDTAATGTVEELQEDVQMKKSLVSQLQHPCGDASSQYIQLKVKDQQGRVVPCTVKMATPMRKLMKACCSRLGFQASQVRFFANGVYISADDTAAELQLENEDLIDVVMKQG